MRRGRAENDRPPASSNCGHPTSWYAGFWNGDSDVIRTATAFAVIAFVGFGFPEMAHGQVFFPPSLSKRTVSCAWYRRGHMPIISDFETKWFSSQLAAAKEPSLFNLTRQGRPFIDVVRFSWVQTFHHPVIVRIEGLNSNTARLVAKQLTGAGGYDPGKIDKEIERQLTRQEVSNLRSLIARTRIASLPARICDGGTDGSQWLIEVTDRDGYHFLNRWTPEQGEVHEFGLAAIKLTGWQFKTIY